MKKMFTKKMRKKIAAVGLFAVVMSVIPANLVFADGADDFEAMGFVYGSEMNGEDMDSEIVFNADIKDDAESFTSKEGMTYTLLTSSSLDGQYKAVSEASVEDTSTDTSADMRTSLIDGNWYKIKAENGIGESAETEAVMALYAHVSEYSDISFLGTGENENRLFGYATPGWYLTNGTMAYRVWSEGSEYYAFNVVGKYDAGRYGESWIGTVCGDQWQMKSSEEENPNPVAYSWNSDYALLDSFQVGFETNEEASETDLNPQYIGISVDLAEGQKSFAFGTDTMLSDYTITNYSDSASLKEVYDEDGNLIQTQMVGNVSADVADPSDPAYVIKYDDSEDGLLPDYEWLGYYNSRTYFTNNTSQDYGHIYDSELEKVVEVQGIDSGMTTSWVNVEEGQNINFSFSVGSVADTGVMTTVVTSTTITVYGADSNNYYALFDTSDYDILTDEPLIGWISGSSVDKDGNIVFTGLTANTAYSVVSIPAIQYDSSTNRASSTNGKSASSTLTALDPDESANITTKSTDSSVTFGNLKVGEAYSYYLVNGTNDRISDECYADENGNLSFEDLCPGTTYYLMMYDYESNNFKSDKFAAKTSGKHPQLICVFDGIYYDCCESCGRMEEVKNYSIKYEVSADKIVYYNPVANVYYGILDEDENILAYGWPEYDEISGTICDTLEIYLETPLEEGKKYYVGFMADDGWMNTKEIIFGTNDEEEETVREVTANEVFTLPEKLISEAGEVTNVIIEDWNGLASLENVQDVNAELKDNREVLSKIASDYMNVDARVIDESSDEGLYAIGKSATEAIEYAYQHNDGSFVASKLRYKIKSKVYEDENPNVKVTIADKNEFGKNGISVAADQEVSVINFEYDNDEEFAGTMKIDKESNLEDYCVIGYTADGETVLIPCWEDAFTVTFEITSNIVQIALVGTVIG